MQQVLELCDTAIWIENGEVKLSGDSFSVVKAYEQSMHGRMQVFQSVPADENKTNFANNITQSGQAGIELKMPSTLLKPRFGVPDHVQSQVPSFYPHQYECRLPYYSLEEANIFRHVSKGGISRWDSEVGLKITGFSLLTDKGFTNQLVSLSPVKFVIAITAEVSGHYDCIYGILLHDLLGNPVIRIWSPVDSFETEHGSVRVVEIFLNPLQLGPGSYTIGISVLSANDFECINNSSRYDLLARSFECSVTMSDTIAPAQASFIHSAEWIFK
jgi:lipopolysaccharide transport system ATP-binding protein